MGGAVSEGVCPRASEPETRLDQYCHRANILVLPLLYPGEKSCLDLPKIDMLRYHRESGFKCGRPTI